MLCPECMKDPSQHHQLCSKSELFGKNVRGKLGAQECELQRIIHNVDVLFNYLGMQQPNNTVKPCEHGDGIARDWDATKRKAKQENPSRKKLEEKLAEKNLHIDALEKGFNKLDAELAAKNKKIIDLEARLEVSRTVVDENRNKLSEKNKRIASLERSHELKDEEIAAYQLELDRANGRWMKTGKERQELNEALKASQEINLELGAKLEDYKQRLKKVMSATNKSHNGGCCL